MNANSTGQLLRPQAYCSKYTIYLFELRTEWEQAAFEDKPTADRCKRYCRALQTHAKRLRKLIPSREFVTLDLHAISIMHIYTNCDMQHVKFDHLYAYFIKQRDHRKCQQLIDIEKIKNSHNNNLTSVFLFLSEILSQNK